MTPMLGILILWAIIIEVVFLAICFTFGGIFGVIIGGIASLIYFAAKLNEND